MTAGTTESTSLLCLAFILLVPFAIAGLALINTGLGRSRSAAHAMTSSLCVVSVAVLVYFAIGFAIQGPHGSPSHALQLGRKSFDWIGTDGFFFRGVRFDGSMPSLVVLLGLFSTGLTSLIPLGAAAERWRLGAACTSTLLTAGWTLPLFAHWAWNGWLIQLSANAGLGSGFIDAGGSGVIQVTGGLTALSLAWQLGPRRGKYSSNSMPAAIPAHNEVFVLFGCMLAWIGWLGLNSAGAILYAGLPAETPVLAVSNTTLSATASALTAAGMTRVRFRKPDASLIANGWMAGLVASSAGCAALKPATAILTGLIAGALVILAIEFLEFTLKVDDPCGSISVHAIAGIWGLLAVGIFTGVQGQFVAQLVGVATLLGFVLPMTYGLNWVLGSFISHRVSPEGERQGMDLHELGADAYPEFVVHTDEFTQR
jgi:ammonium transporter, Amt family